MVWYSCFIVLYLHSICTLLTNLWAVFRLCKKEVRVKQSDWIRKSAKAKEVRENFTRLLQKKIWWNQLHLYTEQNEELDRD